MITVKELMLKGLKCEWNYTHEIPPHLVYRTVLGSWPKSTWWDLERGIHQKYCKAREGVSSRSMASGVAQVQHHEYAQARGVSPLDTHG